MPAMGKRKSKSKRKNNHNVVQNCQKKTKKAIKHIENSITKTLICLPNNKYAHKPNAGCKSSGTPVPIVQKISTLSKEAKTWFQNGSKNIIDLIKSKKKQILHKINLATKKLCTKLLETVEQDFNSKQITAVPSIVAGSNKENEVRNKIFFAIPKAHSSPVSLFDDTIRYSNEISKIDTLRSLETTPKSTKNITPRLFSNASRLLNHPTPKSDVKQLMSLDGKPSQQLEKILKEPQQKSHEAISASSRSPIYFTKKRHR